VGCFQLLINQAICLLRRPAATKAITSRSRGVSVEKRARENRRAETGDSPSHLATRDFVVVTVSDSGAGMNEATLAHAFEPFFTTKEPGHGSGLGLSMVQGFAAQSGGAVQIVSSPGEGTQVTLWLPSTQPNGVRS
jgi:signal transduction histidine kinase